MNRPHRRDHNAVPLGRRVAELRARRGMSQQAFADRLGKSKSWVDKVERGVRKLDRYSVIREIADVLRLDPAILLGPRQPSPTTTPDPEGIDVVRAALASYHHRPTRTVTADQARRQVAHAWMSYQHARYTQLLNALPALLDATHGTRGLLVSTYRITAAVLVKLGEPHLAWLAADRAVTTAAGGPILTGTATIVVTQALRALNQHHLALTAALSVTGTGDDDTVRGTLFLQAGLAAAGTGDRRKAHDLLDHAADLADRRTSHPDPHHTSFGPVAVQLARSLAAHHLGDITEAVQRHEHAIRHHDWRRLPPEHRAAHLIESARAYLDTGDLVKAGQKLVEADGLAPAEVRCRPAARTLLTELTQRGPAPAGIARLTSAVNLGR
ncbi:transcriptional regulator [Micromonospora qiuiae]|uniref:Transcriptional regulator n=1 Tax=Micromonospora qiuiae TaxID=502268 RepID=A0ABQ4J524_9ACTN|nr:helix-turn-helix domain-containing protein [Micromonospora qiuiae]GIJ25202.1 transcriptional regulator [Micromonospora qiuiae]